MRHILLLVAVAASCTGCKPPTAKERVRLRAYDGEVTSLAFSADGKTLVTAGGKEIRLWDVRTEALRAVLREHDGVTSLACSPDGKTLALGCHWGTIRLRDLGAGKEKATLCWKASPPADQLATAKMVDRAVRSLAFSPDGRMLAAGEGQWMIRLWEVVSGKVRLTLNQNVAGTWSVAFSPDGKILVSAGSDAIRLWDVQTGKAKALLPGHDLWLYSVAFSPDGRCVAAADESQAVKGVRLWDVATGKLRLTMRCPAAIECLAFDPNGKALAVGGDDGAVRFWDVVTARQIEILEAGAAVHRLAFSADGKLLAANPGYRLKLWDRPTAKGK